MSIKQSILTLCLLFGVSFSAFARLYMVTGSSHSCVQVGQIIDFNSSLGGWPYAPGVCAGLNAYGNTTTGLQAYSGGRLIADAGSSYLNIGSYSLFGGCPEGEELVDGFCKPPPPLPFCSRPETEKQMSDFAQSCSAQGEGYQANIICRDEDEYLEMNCDAPPPPPDECTPDSPDWPNCKPPTECTPDMPEYPACCDESNNYCDNPPPEECTIFSPNWPECSGDTDIDPDTGDGLGDPDKPDGGGTGNPDPDKPEPDVENNTEVLGAISDLNKDMNKQLTGINNDLNKNHAESKSALDALKASVDLNTDTIVDGANHLQDSIEGQTKTLSDIGNKTNGLLTSANHLLNSGFSNLSGDLDSLKNSNKEGFGSVVDAIDGLKHINVDEYKGTPDVLYTSAEYNAMLGEVSQLKEEYKSVLNDFKRYFNFNSGVNSGDFNAHNLPLNWRGNPINQQNQVMTTLRDNSGIVGAVVIFFFGMLGIKTLTGAL
ncbi:chemotaxis protein [Vibrio rotiferianus]|uniref:chemotaxis protein n=1 Tax=Vibrio rotiferianus TaxID=190895 RepID=UPI00390C1370